MSERNRVTVLGAAAPLGHSSCLRCCLSRFGRPIPFDKLELHDSRIRA